MVVMMAAVGQCDVEAAVAPSGQRRGRDRDPPRLIFLSTPGTPLRNASHDGVVLFCSVPCWQSRHDAATPDAFPAHRGEASNGVVGRVARRRGPACWPSWWRPLGEIPHIREPQPRERIGMRLRLRLHVRAPGSTRPWRAAKITFYESRAPCPSWLHDKSSKARRMLSYAPHVSRPCHCPHPRSVTVAGTAGGCVIASHTRCGCRSYWWC